MSELTLSELYPINIQTKDGRPWQRGTIERVEVYRGRGDAADQGAFRVTPGILPSGELRTHILDSLGFHSKEIAHLTYGSADTVRQQRRRICNMLGEPGMTMARATTVSFNCGLFVVEEYLEPFDLTPRQFEAIDLAAQGLKRYESGIKTSLSEATIATHRNHALERMDVPTIASAVLLAHLSGQLGEALPAEVAAGQ